METEVKDETEQSEQEKNLLGITTSGTSNSDGEQGGDVEQQESEDRGSEEPSPEKGSEEPSPKSEDVMPEGYQGLSAAQIAKMHSELSRKLGEQGEELGRYRGIVDAQTQPKETAPDVSDQMYSDPAGYSQRIKQEAAAEVIGVLPRMLDARDAMSKLNDDFPGWETTGHSPAFIAWANTNIPASVYEAGKSDPNVTHFILSQYKDVTGNAEAQAKADENKSTRRRTAKGAASVPATAPVGEKGIWKESDIQIMIRDNPQEYEARQDEIIKAYQEGRVRK